MGYYRAGFDVVGVDIKPMPRYPFEFHQADALDYVSEHGHEFDAIHASPPCQRYSKAQRIQCRTHPGLIPPTRKVLLSFGLPWVIENVVGAPLIGPVTLCGMQFPGLLTYRHREFEANIFIPALPHRAHIYPQTKMGRPPKPGEFIQVVGNYSGAEYARKAMGISWMTRDELREAVPPAYTEYVGRYLMAAVVEKVA